MCKGVCLQFSHLLSTHPYFLSKWYIMEHMRKSLVWLNSGIKHYKCIYIQTVSCILYSDQKKSIFMLTIYFSLPTSQKCWKLIFRDQYIYMKYFKVVNPYYKLTAILLQNINWWVSLQVSLLTIFEQWIGSSFVQLILTWVKDDKVNCLSVLKSWLFLNIHETLRRILVP